MRIPWVRLLKRLAERERNSAEKTWSARVVLPRKYTWHIAWRLWSTWRSLAPRERSEWWLQVSSKPPWGLENFVEKDTFWLKCVQFTQREKKSERNQKPMSPNWERERERDFLSLGLFWLMCVCVCVCVCVFLKKNENGGFWFWG